MVGAWSIHKYGGINVMTNKDAIDIINNEITCILSTKCKREECANCNLVLPEKDILEALNMAIDALGGTLNV